MKLDNEAVYRQRISGKLKPGEKLKVIDLFSGVGGLTLGFSEKFGHSFVPVWANDIIEEGGTRTPRGLDRYPHHPKYEL